MITEVSGFFEDRYFIHILIHSVETEEDEAVTTADTLQSFTTDLAPTGWPPGGRCRLRRERPP